MGKGRIRTKYYLAGAGMVMALIMLILISQLDSINKTVNQFTSIKGPIKNPYIGFAPQAADEEAVGDASLVYVELTWRDWEPEEGEYDTRALEQLNHLNQWRQQGKNVVLRFVCDSPGSEAHLDIPDWLYEQTRADGKLYETSYGKGYAPNYENELFIKKHEAAIKALGYYYGDDCFFCYIELGSIGHWGEWHVNYIEDAELPRIPDYSTCQKYVVPYINAFPYAKLLMRRPFEWVDRLKMGVYNDMTGDEEETARWLSWLEQGGSYDEPLEDWELKAVPEIWKQQPVGGEFTSSVSMEEILDTDLESTLSMLERSHMSFIGPKAPVNEENGSAYQEGVDAVLNALGYRYEITKAVIDGWGLETEGQLELYWENTGTAPLYWDYPVMLYVIDVNGEIVDQQEIDLELSELYGGENTVTFNRIEITTLAEGTYRLGIAILDPYSYQPAIRMGMASEMVGEIAIVGTVKN